MAAKTAVNAKIEIAKISNAYELGLESQNAVEEMGLSHQPGACYHVDAACMVCLGTP